MSIPFFSSLQFALSQQKEMRVGFGQKEEPYVSIGKRKFSKMDPATQGELLCEIAEVAAKQLSELDRLRPKESLNHIAAESTRQLLKKVPKERLQDPRIENCKRELLAFKLGVSSNVFKKNPEFEKFASNPPLERYLAEYGHSLQEQTEGNIEILEGGKYRPWKEIRHIVEKRDVKDPSKYQPWLYGPQGVQNKNMFEWDQLSPYKTETPTVGRNRHVFEFCCCCEKDPRYVGDHSWLRLKEPNGDTYCVGKYRPYKTDPQKDAKSPMRVKPGLLMQPDVSEFWPVPIHRIPIEVTPEEFTEMKRTIEADKARDREIFQLVEHNCTEYVKRIARIAQIQLPHTERPAWRLLLPKMEMPVDAIAPWIPSRMQTFTSSTMAATLQLGLLWEGANKIDSKVANQNPKPFFNGVRDLFDANRLVVGHPHNVAYRTRPAVMRWRAEERKKLEARKKELELEGRSSEELAQITEQIASVEYALPDSMRTKSTRNLT